MYLLLPAAELPSLLGVHVQLTVSARWLSSKASQQMIEKRRPTSRRRPLLGAAWVEAVEGQAFAHLIINVVKGVLHIVSTPTSRAYGAMSFTL